MVFVSGATQDTCAIGVGCRFYWLPGFSAWFRAALLLDQADWVLCAVRVPRAVRALLLDLTAQSTQPT